MGSVYLSVFVTVPPCGVAVLRNGRPKPSRDRTRATILPNRLRFSLPSVAPMSAGDPRVARMACETSGLALLIPRAMLARGLLLTGRSAPPFAFRGVHCSRLTVRRSLFETLPLVASRAVHASSRHTHGSLRSPFAFRGLPAHGSLDSRLRRSFSRTPCSRPRYAQPPIGRPRPTRKRAPGRWPGAARRKAPRKRTARP